METRKLNESDDRLLDDGLLETPQKAKERYIKAREKLTEIFFNFDHNHLHQEMNALIKLAKHIVSDADEAYDKTDAADQIRFSTLADSLECIGIGIIHPDDTENFRRISTLAGSVETQASVGMKIAAGLVLAVGILSILAFGALVIASKGVALAALPFIGPAIATGLGWITAAATTLGISSTLLASVGLGASAAVTGGGIALAIHGQARGLAGSMFSFHNQLKTTRTKAQISDTDFTTDPALGLR